MSGIRGDPHALPKLAASKDVKLVQHAIAGKYGFTPPAAYCRDFLAFFDAMNARIAALEARVPEREVADGK